MLPATFSRVADHSVSSVSTGLARLEREIERVAERLRTMSDLRLAAPCPPFASVAEAGHQLAQRLAVLAAELEGAQRREVPVLSPLAVGDQVALTGHDVALAVRSLADDTAAAVAVETALAELLAVRRTV